MSRYAILEQINQLDPVTDHERIVYLAGLYEYPWLMMRALEFALFRTFAVPHTSRLLNQTGEFKHRPQKRYDDTTLILSEIVEHGYSSPRGAAAIARMNAIHGRYKIANREFIYVLSTFMLEPTRWHERYGWRQPTEREKQANFYFWRAIGLRMGIRDIPETLEAMEAYSAAHEEKFFRYDAANHELAEDTVRYFLRRYPAPLRPFARQVIYSFLNDRLREAFGYPQANPVIRWISDLGLRLLGQTMRYLPPRKKPFIYTARRHPTYPDGYTIEELGPAEENPSSPAAIPDHERHPAEDS